MSSQARWWGVGHLRRIESRERPASEPSRETRVRTGSSKPDEYFGQISDVLAAEVAKWDEPFTHLPVHAAGFTRTTVR
jgi:hypothetical protein